MSYAWKLETFNGDSVKVNNLQSEVAGHSGQGSFSLNSADIVAALDQQQTTQAITIELTVTNWLGKSDIATHVATLIVDAILPNVVVDGGKVITSSHMNHDILLHFLPSV